MIYEYKCEIGSVCYGNDFEKQTVELLKSNSTKKGNVVLKKSFYAKTIVAVIAIIALLSTTAFAVSYYISVKEVSEQAVENTAAKMFNEDNFDIITVTGDSYKVGFHGIVSYRELESFEGGELEENCSYAVFFISKTDGTSLKLINGMPLSFAPVIDDYNPLNVWSVILSASGLEKDSILYYLFKYENLEIFADKNVSVAVFEGNFPTNDILTLDKNGKTVYAEGYNGFKAMFSIPMDKSKTNPEKAKKLLGDF